MTFRYFVVTEPEEPDRPRGLLAVNRDNEAGRLDTMIFSHWSKRWESDPEAVGMYLFGDDFQDLWVEVRRADAEKAAAVIGTSIPSEDELMQITDRPSSTEDGRGERRRRLMADLYVDVDALTELARQLEAVKAALARAEGNVDSDDAPRRSRAAPCEGA